MLHAIGVPLAGAFMVIHFGLEGTDCAGGHPKAFGHGDGGTEKLEEKPRTAVAKAVGDEVVEGAGICARIMRG